jgi:hypothetical protein
MAGIIDRPGDTAGFNSFASLEQPGQEIIAPATPASRQPWEIIAEMEFDIPVGQEQYNITAPHYYKTAIPADLAESALHVIPDTSELPKAVLRLTDELKQDFARRQKEVSAAAATEADPAFRDEVAVLIGHGSETEQAQRRGGTMLAGVGRLFAKLGRRQEVNHPPSSTERIRANMATTLQGVLDRDHPFGRHELDKVSSADRIRRVAGKIAGIFFERESPLPTRPTIQPSQAATTIFSDFSLVGSRHRQNM